MTFFRTLISFHPAVLVTVKVLSLPECVVDFGERKLSKQMLLFAEPNLGEALRSHLNFPDNVVRDSNSQNENTTHFIIRKNVTNKSGNS